MYIKVARKTYNKTSYLNHLASKTIHAWLILLYLYSHPSSLWSDGIYRNLIYVSKNILFKNINIVSLVHFKLKL